MSHVPRLSVVVPARDAERWIGAAIDSVNAVLDGIEGGHEIVVADDASTDHTAGVAAGHANTKVVRTVGSGIGAAVNTAVSVATGTFLAACDADDLWEPHDFEARLAAVDGGDMVVSVGLLRTIDPSGREIAAPVPAWVRGGLVMRADVWRRVGPYRTDRPLGEFVEWWSRARDAGVTAVQHPEVTYARRVHGENTVLRLVGQREGYARSVRDVLIRRREAHQ